MKDFIVAGPGKLFYKTFLYLLDTAATFIPFKGEKHRSRERVLVVRPDGIGDFLLFAPALRGIREYYSRENYEITLIANTSLGEIASAASSVDEVVLLDRRSFLQDPLYRWRIMRKIRRNRYIIALNPVFSRVAMIDDSIIRVTRASKRIAWQGNLDNTTGRVKNFADKWYTRLIPGDKAYSMELLKNAQFVRSLGYEKFTTPLPCLDIPQKWRISAHETLEDRGVRQPYYVLLPGTGLPPERAWPLERYGEMSKHIVKNGMGEVLVCGNKDDRRLGNRVVNLSGVSHVHDLTGDTTLGTLAALMQGAEAVIGSDTGGVHLAAAVGGRAVCILGGAFPERFFPYRIEKEIDGTRENFKSRCRPPVVVKSSNPCWCPNWSCTRQDWEGGTFPCLTEIGVDKVLLALGSLLDNSTGTEPYRQ